MPIPPQKIEHSAESQPNEAPPSGYNNAASHAWTPANISLMRNDNAQANSLPAVQIAGLSLESTARGAAAGIGAGVCAVADLVPFLRQQAPHDAAHGEAQQRVEGREARAAEAPRPAEPALTERERRLVDTMRGRGASEADLTTFRNDLITLRGRGLPERELNATLDQVERLMNSRGDHPISQDLRRNVGMQIIHHAAKPTEIDQGYHNTCNVTTLEERLFTRRPSIAAEMIVSAATTGQWTAPDGRTIRFNGGGAISFAPGREERATYPADGQRSFASQIFQVVAVNDATQRRNPPQFYRQDMTAANARDTGERLYYEGNVPVTERKNGRDVRVTSPTLGNNEIAQIGQRLTGERGYFLAPPGNGGDCCREIRSRQQLEQAVQDLARRGQLPATLFVDANYPGLGGSGLAKNHGQWHVISILGFDPRTGRMQVSNQWGSRHDREIASNDLFQAMGGWPR